MASVPCLKMSNGISIPTLGLGTFESRGTEQVEKAINAAIDAGYRHFDTALLYENEAEIGDALRKRIADGTVTRDEIFITTKLLNTHHHPDVVERVCREAVDRFQLDYIDLFVIHWPINNDLWMQNEEPDDSIDFVDTYKAMQCLVDKGYVKSIGLSNFNHKQIQRILDCNFPHKPVCNQIEVSPYLTNDKLLEFCKLNDIVVVGYAPLGANNSPWNKKDFPVLLNEPIFLEIGKKYNKTAAQVALRWGLQRGYCIIPKSSNPERIRENMQVFDFELTTEEMTAISKLNRNFRYYPFTFAKRSIYYPFNEEY